MQRLLISPWWLCENLCSQVSLQSCGGRLNVLPSKRLLLRWYLDRLTCQGQVTGPASRPSATTWSCSFARRVVNARQSYGRDPWRLESQHGAGRCRERGGMGSCNAYLLAPTFPVLE